jgi:RNA polymerase sigma factor (sigma-70 family)
MKDPAHAADAIVHEAFTPFFTGALPPSLGREIYLTIRRRLRASRYVGDEHADEVFQQVMFDAYSYLARHGGGHEIRHTRGWLHRISLNATLHYLSEHPQADSSSPSSLTALLEGEIQLPDSSASSDLERVRQAIDRLRPRHQEVLRLELVEGLPAKEIQRRMNILSNAYFRKLKCEAAKALREEISNLYAN